MGSGTHILRSSPVACRVTRSRTATYWAITRDELTRCAADAGLRDLVWHEPADSGFYQPVVTATAG